LTRHGEKLRADTVSVVSRRTAFVIEIGIKSSTEEVTFDAKYEDTIA